MDTSAATIDVSGGYVDNCPNDANSGQENADGDLLGDACDPCPETSAATCMDAGVLDAGFDGSADAGDLGPPSSPSSDDGGCGCRVPAQRSNASALAWLALLLPLVRRVRR